MTDHTVRGRSRPTLRALAKARGFGLDIAKSGPWWFVDAVAPGAFSASGPMCVCRCKRAATEGLRAALLALPEVKVTP